ncbi:MAG: sensor histidine kinase [Promethearchaeota archaeon]
MACPEGSVIVWDSLERFLWGIAITIAFICGIYFIRIAKKREVFNERIIMLGLASLPIGFALSLFFTYFQVLQVHGDFNNFIFCGNYENFTEEPYELLGVLSYVSFGLVGTFFVLTYDIIVKHTKFLLTIISSVLIAIEIVFAFLSTELARAVFNYSLILELVFFIPFILFLYTKWSHFEFKAVSSFLFFGFVLCMISLILAKSAHKELNIFPLILSPLFLIAGCFLFIFPIIIDPKIISRPLTYWVIFAILTITLLIVIITSDIFELVSKKEGIDTDWILFLITFLIAIIYISILFYLITKNIHSEIKSKSQEILKEDDTYKTEFLAMFTRPQQVSFLASISHELKTPLTSIIGFTRTILKGRAGEINEEQENQLKIILNNATHLDELINRVLDMTKIEINKLTIRKDKFNLIEELIKLKENFAVSAKEKGLDLFLDAPENLIIYNDKQRINQILINLIRNAIKFTDSGRISIKIKRKKENIIISVKDTGPGIQTEDLKKLFKPFSRILEPGKYTEGSGLGLHLSKKIANLLGGDITVKSKLGKGSTFKLILTREEEDMSF